MRSGAKFLRICSFLANPALLFRKNGRFAAFKEPHHTGHHNKPYLAMRHAKAVDFR
jgi:hypothetical protein